MPLLTSSTNILICTFLQTVKEVGRDSSVNHDRNTNQRRRCGRIEER